MFLADAPFNVPLRIVDIGGGQAVKRRLLSMGFNRGDVIKLDVEAIMEGPLVVRNVTLGTRVALGRGIAGKIIVSEADE